MRTNPLERLIAPLKTSEFFSNYWGKDYFLAKHCETHFASLFSWDALNEILSSHRFEFPRLRLLSGGRVATPERYMHRRTDRRGNAYTTHDSTAVTRMLQSGAMLHITSIGEAWQPLAKFAAELELLVGGSVQVNLHAGYAGSKGFHTHWDGHDVYAAQVDGSKKWRLFGYSGNAPLAVPPEEKRGAPESHVWEGELATGEVLYLPRGYWHATQFTDDPSLHLTFAVQHPTGIDFSNWLIGRLAADVRARRDIPLAFFDLPEVGDAMKQTFLAEMRELIVRCVSPDSLSAFLDQYRTGLGNYNVSQLNPSRRRSP